MLFFRNPRHPNEFFTQGVLQKHAEAPLVVTLVLKLPSGRFRRKAALPCRAVLSGAQSGED